MSKRSIAHIEIPAADRHAAADFYKQLFDWNYDHSTEPMPYTMSYAENLELGLTEPREDFHVGSPLLYITSDDIETDLKQVVELGGAVVTPKSEIPGSGWFATFTDPTGNTLGFIHYES